jgi:tetratricopeptide (TPR) repeat protein
MPKAQQNRKQTVQKTIMPKSQIPKPPEMSSEPGKPDKICKAVFAGGLTCSALLLFGSAYPISHNLLKALHSDPVDWYTIAFMAVLTVVLGFLLRGLVWLSFAGTAMLATHLQAWHAQDMIARTALKFRKVFPGGTGWASQALMGQMANRQQFKELIDFGNAEYEATAKKDQNIAPLCAYMGIAHQMQNDPHSAILWNERAVELFQKAMVPLEKVNTETKLPNREFVDSMIIQYASAYANLGANYFSVSNYGKAKKNFQVALEQLNRAKDCQQKEMLVRGINEHIARLKHW